MPKFLLTVQPLASQQLSVTADTEEEAIASIDPEQFSVLRTQNLDDLYSEFSPCVRFEYDQKYFGGKYDQVGDYAYVPLDFVSDMESDEAFSVFTGIDSVHIVSCEDESNTSELCLADGTGWIESAEEWAEEVASTLGVDGEKPEMYIDVIENDGFYDIAIEVSAEEVCSKHSTGTGDLRLAKIIANSVQNVFQEASFNVFLYRDLGLQPQSQA